MFQKIAKHRANDASHDALHLMRFEVQAEGEDGLHSLTTIRKSWVGEYARFETWMRKLEREESHSQQLPKLLGLPPPHPPSFACLTTHF